MRYHLSNFRKNFFTLMRCEPEYTLSNGIFRTKINKTEIVARGNYLDHITSINIKTLLSSGMFVSTKTKESQIEAHIKSYVMAIGALIDMSAQEIDMMISNMLRRIPYSGKGLISEQHQINDGWEILIKIPISDFETRLRDYNSSVRNQNPTISSAQSFEKLYSAESFIFNMNKNMHVLDRNSTKITEVNLGEFEKTPIMMGQFSNDTFLFLQLESDYKHFNQIHIMKMENETVSSFTQKELAALLCFVPDKVKASSLLLDNFLNEEFDIPITKDLKTKHIKVFTEHNSNECKFMISGSRY